MILQGSRDKLLQKLSATERERLATEALRKRMTAHVSRSMWGDLGWGDFRRSFSWSIRQDLRGAAIILACVLIVVLAAKFSLMLSLICILVLGLALLYGACRFLYALLSSIYVFATWEDRE